MQSLSLTSRKANARILVVDDVEFNVRLIFNTFKQAGFVNLEWAENGEVALQKTRDFLPDLVILDIEMPVLDGFGYCEQIREDDRFKLMPIIVQTAHTESAVKLRALSCGADDFVTKPIDQHELILRSCIHLNRYFTLQDLVDMRTYLEMELDETRNMLKKVNAKKVPDPVLKRLNNHSDVLEAMIINIPFALKKHGKANL